ncbi:MAG: hypothetical protein R3345_08225, partial [Fulvivirga sp.]|nr:hypothetical protein [Fulvivirga sp.]
LWSPHVTWALDSAAKRPAWPAFTLGKIRLIDGKLDLYYDQLLMQSNRLYGVFRQVKDSVLIEVFTIEDFTIDGEIDVPLIDFNHKDDLITLSDLSIQKQNYKLNIPEIQVFKWNQNNLLKEGHFTSAHLLVDRPNVAIKNQDTSQNFALKLPQGTKIDSVAVSQGRFSYTLFNGNDTLKVISIFDLRVENVDHTHSLYHAENLLFGESLQLELTQTAISNSSFDLKFKKIAFNQDLGKVLTENLSFQNKNQDTNIKADKAFLAKPDIPLLFDDNIFEADSLFLQGAQITWRKPIGETRAQAPFNQINLDHLDIAETDVLIDLDTTHQPFHFKNISLSAQKINVDTTTTFNLLVDNLENLSLKGENFAYPIDDGDYIVSVKQYGFDLPTGSAYFNGVTLDPQLDKLAYSNTLTFQKDWFDVEIDTLAINNFDVEAWLERKLYAIENITLQGVNATIFRDKHLPFDSLQRRALPQAIFKRQNFAMQIDTIKVFGDITYSERPKTTTDIASVSFTDLNGRILYATTRDSLYQLPMYLQASGILQQNAPFEAQVTFDMSSPKNPFRFKGKVGEMDLTSMNKLLEPIADIQIKSGLGSEASFVFDGDDDLASGTIDFRYKKLKIIILNQKTHDIQGFTQNLKTFFANSFILRKSNPRLFNFKEGVIFYTRDKKRAIFNFWSKSILSGAVSSVGINRSKRNFLKYQREKEKTDKEKEKITESER